VNKEQGPTQFFPSEFVTFIVEYLLKPIKEMNYKHTFEAAIANLDEIKELLQELSAGDTISSIEIDLALQKTRSFYEVLLMLRHPSGDSGMPGTSASSIPERKTATVKKSSVKESLDTENSSEADRNLPAEDKPDSAPTADKRKKTGVTTDSLGSKKVLGEIIHQPIQYQEISSRLQAKPITNLAAAIGINERFLYIRELFGNDTKKYERAIEIMNNAASFNDAYNYMIREYTWDMDSEMVQGLLELVRRKFITGQHE
jgi:hypothetical protein